MTKEQMIERMQFLHDMAVDAVISAGIRTVDLSNETRDAIIDIHKIEIYTMKVELETIQAYKLTKTRKPFYQNHLDKIEALAMTVCQKVFKMTGGKPYRHDPEQVREDYKDLQIQYNAFFDQATAGMTVEVEAPVAEQATGNAPILAASITIGDRTIYASELSNECAEKYKTWEKDQLAAEISFFYFAMYVANANVKKDRVENVDVIHKNRDLFNYASVGHVTVNNSLQRTGKRLLLNWLNWLPDLAAVYVKDLYSVSGMTFEGISNADCIPSYHKPVNKDRLRQWFAETLGAAFQVEIGQTSYPIPDDFLLVRPDETVQFSADQIKSDILTAFQIPSDMMKQGGGNLAVAHQQREAYYRRLADSGWCDVCEQEKENVQDPGRYWQPGEAPEAVAGALLICTDCLKAHGADPDGGADLHDLDDDELVFPEDGALSKGAIH